MSLKQVLIQGVDMFGSKIGFLKFKADIYDKLTGKKVFGDYYLFVLFLNLLRSVD